MPEDNQPIKLCLGCNMEFNQIHIDLLRAAHLCLFAAGMGTGLYFDFEKFRTLRDPLSVRDIHKLDRLHSWIMFAFCGLWVTGLVLIYVRTSYDISQFSPKLWMKISLMSLMVLNSLLIGRVVIPILRANMGQPLIALPTAQFMVVSQIAILSMFFWSSGLMLGSSSILKLAPWDVLLPLAVGWCLLLTLCGQVTLLVMRRELSAPEEVMQ